MRNKIQVKLSVEVNGLSGKPIYKLESIRGALSISDWVSDKEVPVHPGHYISNRGAENLIKSSVRYDVTVVPSK